jgi:hypothetical protein
MKMPLRIVITLLAVFVAYYASGWFGFLVWTLLTIPFGALSQDFAGALFVQSVCSIVGTALTGWYTWRKTAQGTKSRPGSFSTILQWALIVGGIGFALGFFGPIIFMPGANQGPLLGIFITGPLGFVLGAVAGLWRSLSTSRTSDQRSSPDESPSRARSSP